MALKYGSSPLFPPRPRVLHFHLSRRTSKPPLTLFRFRHGTPVRLGPLRSLTKPPQIFRASIRSSARVRRRVRASWDAHVAFLHPDDRAHSSRNWKEVIDSGKTRDDQFRILGADGKYRWFLTQVDPLRDPDGQIQYWVGVNIDIDDGKRASEELDAVRERMGRATQSAAIAEIAVSLSHSIVQPIAAVVANARAALNWLSSKNLNILQANAALEGVVRDGMSVGNIVHEMRQHLDHRQPNPASHRP
jgi:PAS fold